MTKQDIVLGHSRLSWGRDDSGSPRRQSTAISKWAKANHYPVSKLELYADVEGRHSGRKDTGRPEWTRLKARLSDPQVAAVVVESIDRLFRNLKLLLAFVDDCIARGIRFVAIAENLDFQPGNNPMEAAMSRMSLQQFGALAEMWANLTSAKMQMHVDTKRTDGKHWGTVPFGAILDDNGKLVPHPDTNPRLLRCYQVYVERRGGWVATAEQLNTEGICFRDRWGKDRPFTGSDVRQVLAMHQTYSGHVIKGRSQQKGGPAILVYDAWSPLLPLDLIREAVATQERHARRSRAPERKHVYPLTPLLHCADCGKALSGQYYEGLRDPLVYRHARKGNCRADVAQIKAATAERAVIRLIADLVPPASVWDVLTDLVAESADNDPAAAAKRARIADLQERKERVRKFFFGQVAAGVEVMTIGEMAAQLGEYDKEIASLEEGLTNAQSVANFRDVLCRLADIKKLLERAPAPVQEEIVGQLFQQLTLNLSTGEITTYIPHQWLSMYQKLVIGCARRDSNAVFTTSLIPFVKALAKAA